MENDNQVSREACMFVGAAVGLTIDVYNDMVDRPSLKLRTTDVFVDLDWPWDKERAERIIDELERAEAIKIAAHTSAVCNFYVTEKGAEIAGEGWDENHS